MKKIIAILIATFTMCSSLAGITFAKEAKSTDEICSILNKMDILSGDQNGNYNLEDSLTRSEFTKLAITASTLKDSVPKKSSTSPFSDVTYDYWGTPYIKVAVVNKLVSGYPDSTFRPENPVLLEEGVTILLKQLGYKNEDFMDEWPYAQMGIANNLDLLDNITATQGGYMKRYDAVNLIYNMLNTKSKGSNVDYIETISYKVIEDVVIVATATQDKSLGYNEVNTDAGTFKADNFDQSKIGSKGDILIYENKDIVAFYPDNELQKNYVVYSIFNDEIVVEQNGSKTTLNIKDDEVCYYNSKQMTYKDLKKTLKIGDSLTLITDGNGKLKNVLAEEEKLEGPFTISGFEWNLGDSNTRLIKNSISVSKEDIKFNDIVYYSKNLNTIWAYDKKKTGYYEEAKPNKDFPTSIVVSGMSYEIEGATALNKLSTDGTFNYGEPVTLLIGKDGKVADVIKYGANEEKTVGFVLSTSKKETIKNDNKYVSYYATAVNSNGETFDYPIKSEGTSYRGKVCEIVFKEGITNLGVMNENNSVHGVFDSQTMFLGSSKLSRSVNIIDTKKVDQNRNSGYVKIYPNRLDKVNLKAEDILYSEKNSLGEITALFLNDVTGDIYEYGMMVKAENKDMGLMLLGTYTIDIGGREQIVNTNGSTFTTKSHTPCSFDFDNNLLESVKPLNKIEDGIIKLNSLDLVTGKNEKYRISDKVSVYTVTSDYKYLLTSIDEVDLNDSTISVNAYYDKSPKSGGMVRVITLKKK